MRFIWPILFNFANTRYLFLLVCVICAKSNEAVENSGYANVCFTINSLLKMLPLHFQYFYCSNFKMIFGKNFMRKATIFNFFQISNMTAKFYFLVIFVQLSDYRKYPLNSSRNLYKTLFFAIIF